MRVLVVDDEPDVLVICTVMLEASGHEVIQAADAEEALFTAVKERPDVIVLDVMLPRRDGLSALRELRILPEVEDVPVIVVSARVLAKDQRRGLEAGADAYLTKPFFPDELGRLIELVGSGQEARRLIRAKALESLA